MLKQLLSKRLLLVVEPPRISDLGEFKALASELRSLMPQRDGDGVLQFRVLHAGEKPLNRFARRQIAQRLVTGQYE